VIASVVTFPWSDEGRSLDTVWGRLDEDAARGSDIVCLPMACVRTESQKIIVRRDDDTSFNLIVRDVIFVSSSQQASLRGGGHVGAVASEPHGDRGPYTLVKMTPNHRRRRSLLRTGSCAATSAAFTRGSAHFCCRNCSYHGWHHGHAEAQVIAEELRQGFASVRRPRKWMAAGN
jgi:hypothetical protein